uniref:G-protein coupled receptors family 1 profile domain-containing protein n=1 Tax=Cyanoderma ruficeps TaxID=181631 RepID=A0A8C3R1C6_9PASS
MAATRTVTNIFICSLALSDLLIAAFCVPFTGCRTSRPAGSAVGAGAGPGCGEGTAGRTMRGISECTWDKHLGDSSSLHLLQVKCDFLYEKVHVCCLEEWASPIYQKIYATFIRVMLFFLPLMLVLFLDTKIGYELRIKKRVRDASVLQTIHGSKMSKISRKKQQAIVIMVTVVFSIAVCWAPFHVIHVMMEYSNFEKEYDDVPVVYAFMNENFKKSVLSALCFCLVKDRTSPGRQLGSSGMTTRRQRPSASRGDPMDSDEGRREAFSDGNTEVRHLVLFSSELTVHSAVGSGQQHHKGFGNGEVVLIMIISISI